MSTYDAPRVTHHSPRAEKSPCGAGAGGRAKTYRSTTPQGCANSGETNRRGKPKIAPRQPLGGKPLCQFLRVLNPQAAQEGAGESADRMAPPRHCTSPSAVQLPRAALRRRPFHRADQSTPPTTSRLGNSISNDVPKTRPLTFRRIIAVPISNCSLSPDAIAVAGLLAGKGPSETYPASLGKPRLTFDPPLRGHADAANSRPACRLKA